MNKNWNEWVVDVTLGIDPPCFVPYERERDRLVIGMMVLQPKSPGNIIGVIHAGGEECVNEFIEANPNWQTKLQ